MKTTLINSAPVLRAGIVATCLSTVVTFMTWADSASGREPIDEPIKGHIEEGKIPVRLRVIAEGKGLTAPNWGTFLPGQPNILYVVDQDGPLWAVDINTGAKTLFLNTRGLLVPLGAFGPGSLDERGFLGVAFHPDYAVNGLLYTYTSELPGDPFGQPNHTSFVREWRVPNPTADPLATRTNDDSGPGVSGAVETREVLRFVQPQFNHNGGALFFGSRPDDRYLLYITSGDGGCADDQKGQLGLQGEGPCISHEGNGNAQNPATLLGKLLRIDPLGSNSANGEYGIPPNNPFVGRAGVLPEIFALGLRNPFRASSDRFDLGGTGLVWLGDVGQNQIEEVNARIVPGGNYGWRFKEGTFLFDPAGFELFGFASDGFVFARSPGAPAGFIDPVAEYDHDEGVAVIGGFVYRGTGIPNLRGHYVFGDHSRRPNNGNGEVFYLDESDTAKPDRRTPKIFHLTDGPIDHFVLGFGEDAAGEIYVLGNEKGIPFEERGVIMKIVAP